MVQKQNDFIWKNVGNNEKKIILNLKNKVYLVLFFVVVIVVVCKLNKLICTHTAQDKIMLTVLGNV